MYEQWQRPGLLGKMSTTSARLLVAGILDNTLNFGARVTTQRDKDAYSVLFARANLSDDWTAQYFRDCQEAILKDITGAIRKDTKILSFRSRNGPICFGQMVVWDGKQILDKYEDEIKKLLTSMQPAWCMNVVSVGEGRSYFVAEDSSVQKWLTHLLGIQFDSSVAPVDRLWLRKEVIKQDIKITSQ